MHARHSAFAEPRDAKHLVRGLALGAVLGRRSVSDSEPRARAALIGRQLLVQRAQLVFIGCALGLQPTVYVPAIKERRSGAMLLGGSPVARLQNHNSVSSNSLKT